MTGRAKERKARQECKMVRAMPLVEDYDEEKYWRRTLVAALWRNN